MRQDLSQSGPHPNQHPVQLLSEEGKTHNENRGEIQHYLNSILYLLKTNSSQMNKSFNSRLNIYFGVLQDWYNSKFQNEDSDPYPNSNGGQT